MTRIPLNNLAGQAQNLKDRLEMSTAEMGLSVRTTNCLEEKGIFTVNDLLHSTRDDLLSISNFGEKTLEEVYQALERIGFYRKAKREAAAVQDGRASQPQALADPPALVYSGGIRSAVHEGLAMRIRCPHCHQPIEMVQDDLAAEVLCSNCGSSFSLISGNSVTIDYAKRQTLGQFELIERVGMGKFGAVWKARDTQLDRIVAVKVPRKDQLNASEQEMFFREARAAAQLKHPNIVGVHEVGRHGDSIFIVSDFVAGANLGEWLTAQRLTPREAVELTAKIADAVAHAHAAGVVHRDLKPGNIMLDTDGQPHITDFGLAKREAGEITMTLDGAVLGTPAYMSPEQARGEAHQANARGDVYSLGVILFELLTGELPFRGETRMLIVQILKEEPPSPRKLNARIPRDLETICLKCLEKDPTRRYATAGELADELRRYLARKPILARPISRPARVWRWCQRNPSLSKTAAAAAGLLLAVLVLITAAYFRERDLKYSAAALATEKSNLATKESAAGEKLKSQAAELNRQLVHNLFERGNGLIAQGKLPQGFAYLQSAYEKSPKSDPIRLSIAKILGGWTEVAPIRLQHRGMVSTACFSPDGSTILTGCVDGTARVWDAATGKPIGEMLKHDGAVTAAAFSSDGVTLLTGSADKTARLWDARSGNPIGELMKHNQEVYYAVFDPTGSAIVTASADSTVHRWDAHTGKSLGETTRRVKVLGSSPDGAIFLTVNPFAESLSKTVARLWETRTGKPVGQPINWALPFLSF